jgi:hypothetical protein
MRDWSSRRNLHHERYGRRETIARYDALVFAEGSKIRAAALALAGCLTVGAPASNRGEVVASVQPEARDFG